MTLSDEFVEIGRSLCCVEVNANKLCGANRLDVDINNHLVAVDDIRCIIDIATNYPVIVAPTVRLGDIEYRGQSLNCARTGEVGVGFTNEVPHSLHSRTFKGEEETTYIDAVKRRFLVLKCLLTPNHESVTVEVAEHVDTEFVEGIALCLVRTNRNILDCGQATIVKTERSPPREVVAVNLGHNWGYED